MNENEFIANATRRTVLILTSVIVLSIPLVIVTELSFYFVLFALTGLAALPFLVSIERIVYLLTFYIVVFGVSTFNGILFPVSVSYTVIDLCLLAVFLLMIMDISTKGVAVSLLGSFGTAFLVFFMIAALSGVIGFKNGNDLADVYREFRLIFYYAVYFVVIRYFRAARLVTTFLVVILSAALIASLDAIYTYDSLQLIRFVSRQIHIIALIVPFLVCLMILDTSKSRRVLYFAILIPMAISIVISQTRGTWFTLLVAITLSAFLALLSKLKGRRLFVSFAFTLISLILVLSIGLNVIAKMSRSRAEFVQERVASVSNLGADYSLIMRANSYLVVLDKIKSRPWFGNGLGASATYNFFGRYSTQRNVDSTYLTILWKMGILGLVCFVALYVLLLWKAFQVFRKSDEFFPKCYSIGVLSSFTAFLLLGIISPILITSRFNLIFGAIFAITDILHKERTLFSNKNARIGPKSE